MKQSDFKTDWIVERVLMLMGSPETTRFSSGGTVDTIFDLMPSDFLSFAEKDLQTELTHKHVNAFANAKRALDCQADRLLKVLGFYEESQAKFWGFPSKLLVLNRFGILAPRILNKVNQQRNLLEHKFVNPDTEKVIDFIDVVALFLASTEKYVSGFSTESSYTYNGEVNNFQLNINFYEFDLFFNLKKKAVTISITDIEYFSRSRAKNKKLRKLTSNISYPNESYISLFKYHLNKITFF